MTLLTTIIAFALVLGVLVIVHEAGHFFVARRNGVKVEEFGLGLPPRAIGFYKDANGRWQRVGLKTKEAPNTIWSLNWIPLGGFVKIKGEEGEGPVDTDSFVSKPISARIFIISAGVLMNVILAAVLLTITLTVGSPQVVDDSLPKDALVRDVQVRVMQVLPDSPAGRAGVTVADTVVTIDGKIFPEIEQIQQYMDEKVGETITLGLVRKDQPVSIQVTPEILKETERGGIGIALVKTGLVSYPWYISWRYGIVGTLNMVAGVIYGFFVIIKSLVTSGQVMGEVYGPVGIATLVGDAVQLGFLYLLQFTATLSVIIAVVNFLPFPALDGGRVLFLIIEGIRRKPVNRKIEAAMHNAGFALLMLLVLFVTFKDVARITGGFGNWWQGLINLF